MRGNKISEKLLLHRIRTKRDPQAFGELYDLYIDKIYRFIFFKVSSKEIAEDITSDVFLKTWNYLTDGKKREIKSFSGLLYRVARTSLVDFYRKQGREISRSEDLLQNIIIDDDQYKLIHNRYEVEQVLKVVSTMKRDYQEILTLRYIDELSVSEIADILEKKSTNVRVTIHRALKVLKKLIDS